MILYRITRHPHLEGVRLSRPGVWGNMPHATEADAEAAAAADAGKHPFRLEFRAYPALPEFRQAIVRGL